MLFTSIDYFVFLAIVFVVYWFLSKRNVKFQNVILLISSLYFYGLWDWRLLGLLLLTAGSTFLSGILIEKSSNKKILFNKSFKWLVSFFTIVLNIGILVYFKYYNFFVQGFINAISFLGFDFSMQSIKIILPVGISFYTFSSLSYTFDVYAEKVKPTKDIIAYFTYITFFPAILSGPISRATKQLPQYIKKRHFSFDQAVKGGKMLVWGFFMKLVVADRLGLYVDAVYGNVDHHNGSTMIVAAILYSIQIYCDFGGYSLMGIGTGKLLGINLQPNFVRPYFSQTITEFWRRWHISLTTWFRDYIYFPMGGNRVKRTRWMLNVMVVFIVSGIWHGAAYAFLIWGGMHGIALIVEKISYGKKLGKLPNKRSIAFFSRMIFTFIIVTIAWIFFRATSFDTSIKIVHKIFTEPGKTFIDIPVFVFGGIGIIILIIKDIYDEYAYKTNIIRVHKAFSQFVFWAIIMLIIISIGIFDGGQFIYFQF